MTRADVVVIGGGPAGSTVATLLKKYQRDLEIVLLEKEVFPRHHVGESLLSGGTPVLKELGVYEKVNTAGFPEKVGATYVWGKDGGTWGFEFEEINGQLQRQGVSLPKQYFKGWQVRRADYDKLLLDHASERGVVVFQGASVEEVRLADAETRGVTYRRNGEIFNLDAGFIVDASGQNAIVGRRLGERRFDEKLRNVAIYGYWKGARWKFAYTGFPNTTRILIASTEKGWIWYIPVDTDIVSVGFVLPAEHAKKIGDLDGAYLEEIKQSPEIADLLVDATLTRLSDDQKSLILKERDWSYTSERMVGEGWLSVGDAAGFVDPILSSGVMLAHQNGQKAAYTINSALREPDAAIRDKYFKFYEDTYKETLLAYRQMACYWYGNNFSRDTWWWQAWRDMMQNNEQTSLSHRDSFMRLASGYANRPESTSLFGSYTAQEALFLADHLFNDYSAKISAFSDGSKVCLSADASVSEGLFFHKGLIHRTDRIINRCSGKFLDLYPGEEDRIKALTGTIDVATFLKMEFSNEKLGQISRTPAQLLDQIRLIGVLEIDGSAVRR
jgi:flavin-dependent dehydrogenase